MRRCGRVLTMALAATAVLATTGAEARGGRHTHDGFFLRLSAGFGAVTESSLAFASGVITSGEPQPATITDFAIGGVIGRNLALHFSAFGSVLDRRSSILAAAGDSFSKQKTVTGFGPGITYYFMPSNLYVTAAVGGATMVVEYSDGVKDKTPGGFAFMVGVGKEWWVSANWGIGLAAHLAYARVTDAIGVWNTGWAGVVFSATYN